MENTATQEKQPENVELLVEGMTCTNCALSVRKELEKQNLENISVDFSSGEVRFKASDKQQIETVKKRIQSIGYQVMEADEAQDQHPEKRTVSSIEKKFYTSLIFTVPLLLSMIPGLDFLHQPYLQLSLALPVFIIGLIHFGRSALGSLKAGVPNMDVLIILGASAAFIYSLIGTLYKLGPDFLFYETSASIITIVLLGNLLEHRSVKKTTSAIKDLVKLQKTEANKISIDPKTHQEKIETVNATDLKKSDLILINTGDKIPADGEIYWGSGSVDESMITGESIPVEKETKSAVIGGTILVNGTLKVRTTAVGKSTALSQIIELVKSAQGEKPKMQNLADKVSAIFVPVVVGIAILTFLISYFAVSISLSDSLMHSVAVLVIACPCAMGLAIPTAVVVGIGRVSKNGILIKGGLTMEKLAGIKQIVFDKTGTLTTGKFKIDRIESPGGEDIKKVKSVILSLETHSSHPIAQSLVNELKDISPLLLENVQEEKGIGISGTDTKGNTYRIGSYKIAEAVTDDHTHSLYLLENNELFATIDISDEIKPEAAETIQYLKKNNIEPILLSGDKKEKCEALAQKLGILKVYAEQLPHEKLGIIEKLSETGSTAMVGDGINDAPALTKANVGISLSNATQIAIQSAQVILLEGDLELLQKTISISKNTLRTIRQNLFWAFFYNVCAIPIAAVGLLSPIIAAFAMAFSDVIVVGNSLRLRTRKLD